MKRQKVIITLSTGEVVTFTGPAQVDTSKPIKVRKFQFTVPRISPPPTYPPGPTDDDFDRFFGGFLRGKGKPIP